MRIGMGPLFHHADPILNPQLILAALRPSQVKLIHHIKIHGRLFV